MKHRQGTSTILITAATASWRVLLTQWKKKLTAHLCNVDCFVCSWLISERKWACANVRVQFWNVEDPDSSPSSGLLREKLLLLFQYSSPISVLLHSCTAFSYPTLSFPSPSQVVWTTELMP